MLQDGICDNADILNSTPPKKVIYLFIFVNCRYIIYKLFIYFDNKRVDNFFGKKLSVFDGSIIFRLFRPTMLTWLTSHCKLTYLTRWVRKIKLNLRYILRQHCQSFKKLNFLLLDNMRSLFGCMIDLKRKRSMLVIL